MARVLSAEAIARKFKANAQRADGDYEYGARNPRRDWKEAAIAGEEAFAAAMLEVITNGLRAAGIRRIDARKWIDRIVAVGKARYREGVSGAEEKYKSGVRPYLELLQSLMETLPPRGPKGSVENYERSRAIGEALHQLKVELGAA